MDSLPGIKWELDKNKNNILVFPLSNQLSLNKQTIIIYKREGILATSYEIEIVTVRIVARFNCHKNNDYGV